MRCTTTSERKEVFVSNSKFQIESVRKQVTNSKKQAGTELGLDFTFRFHRLDLVSVELVW